MKRSSEFAAEVAQALKNKEAAAAQDVVRRAAAQQAYETKQKAEYKALCATNEARLRATGVVALFEQLRDSKVVVWRHYKKEKKVEIRSGLFNQKVSRHVEYEDVAEPAGVGFSGENHDTVYLVWDAEVNASYTYTGEYPDDPTLDSYSEITAKLSTSGRLVINDRPLTDNLRETIKTAILNPVVTRPRKRS